MNTITMSALIITLFLGGPSIPWDVPFFTAVSPLWFLLKLLVLLYIYVLLRATLPRFRYDQLMDLGWKKLIPASLLWLLLLAAGDVANGDKAEVFRNLLFAGAGIAAVWGLLSAAMRVGRKTSDQELAASNAADKRLSTGRF